MLLRQPLVNRRRQKEPGLAVDGPAVASGGKILEKRSKRALIPSDLPQGAKSDRLPGERFTENSIILLPPPPAEMRPAQAGNRTSSLAVEARHAGGGWLLRLRGRELDNAFVDGQVVGLDKLEQDSVHPGGAGSRPPQAADRVGINPE